MATTHPNKDLRKFRTAVILAVAFAVLSIGCKIASTYLIENTYRTYVGISASTAEEERISTYTRAIELAPRKTDAYLLLLNTYGEDGTFGKRESEQFLAVYNANHTKLKENTQDYAQLQSMIGLLYINGYEDQSTVTRLRMALPFLRTANEALSPEDPQKETINCYCQIGAFYEDYIWSASSVKEITEPIMENLLSEIEATLAAFREDGETDSVFNILGFDVAVCDLLNDQRDILAVTIPQERVETILDQIFDNLPNAASLQKEQTKQMLQLLQDNRKTYYEMVERAYSRKGA